MVVKSHLVFYLSLFLASTVYGQDTTTPAPTVPAPEATTAVAPVSPIVEKELEVAMGIDAIEKVDFDYNTKISIGNEQLLKLVLVPQKREVIFKGLKPGRTTVTIRDNLGDVRLRYTVVITATGKSNIVSELRELIGNIEGLEIGIRGGKVTVEGEIVVPDDIGRVSKVLASYPEVLTLIELSPQTQRIIAKKMSDELARNNLKDVSVRVVNKAFWLEGVVSSKDKKDLALIIAKAYLPPKIRTLSETGEGRFASPGDASDIIDFIAINEKKDPQPAPKMVKVSSQFVELSKSYNKIFAFKWASLMGEDSSSITFGQTEGGNITSTSSGTLSATITNLFPKLNSAKTAGYARIIQSGMVIMRDQKKGTITKDTTIPFAVGSGDFTKASSASVGLNMDIEPRILEQEKVEMAVNISVKMSVGSGTPPITTNNSISTNIVIKSKESAAIGGIVQNQSTTDYDNEPSQGASGASGAAPATPLFRLYRSKSYITNKSQYVIFLTPEIIESASVGTEEIQKNSGEENSMAGHIISIIGGKGGVGKSQVAANLALAYAAEIRAKTLLLDFDQKACGDQNIITGLKSKKSVKDLSEFNGSIDPRSIQLFTADHKSGISFIGMPTESLAANQINEDGLGKALKAIVNIYPLTIIDAGSELTPLTLKALEYSTLIFLVATPDLLAVNQCRRMYSDLVTMLFPKDMIQILVNQAVNGHPVSPEVIGKQIGKPVFHSIPKDEASCIAALSRSTPVLVGAKNSAFGVGVTDCARKLIQKNVLKTLEKLAKPQDAGTAQPGGAAGAVVSDDKKKDQWTELKSRIHKALVEEMDLKKQDDKDPKAKIILREQTKKMVVELLGKEDTKSVLASRDDMNRIVKEILDEALGLGPLEDLLADKTISEIMVVGPKKIYYEQSGKVKKSEITFTNDRQVMNVIERIVAPIGRRIDEKTPYVDARLPDGSRVHAIIPPCAIDGCCITIRKFPDKRLNYKDLVKYGSLTEEMADFLRISVEAHRNLVVSGGTGSGKTTLINMLGGFIQSNERIITCEDSAELNFPQDHVVRLETRPPSLEGDGEIDIRCLVKQTLRMRPDRIVVGECRGGETLDMLQAMNTGHDGSMTTVHSNTPRDAISRLETLVQYAGAGLPQKAIKEMIASAVHMIIQQSRLDDGSRKILYITEIGGIQSDVVTLQDIFVYKQEGIGKDGKITGKFMATGFIPKFIETLEKKGYKVPRGLFVNKG